MLVYFKGDFLIGIFSFDENLLNISVNIFGSYRQVERLRYSGNADLNAIPSLFCAI